MSSTCDFTHTCRADRRRQAVEYRDGLSRQTSQWFRGRPNRRHDDAGRPRGRTRPRRARFLPAVRRLPRKDVFGGQIPRRLHQARGPADHQGNPDLAVDRPADPAALSRLVSRRSADPGGPDLRGPVKRCRRPVDDRRLGGAVARAGAVLGARRLDPAGTHRRQVDRVSRPPRSSRTAIST